MLKTLPSTRGVLAAIAILAILGLLLTASRTGRARAGSEPRQAQTALVVLGEPGDPYYPLAQEIAAAELALLADSLAAALDARPNFLLWVVSPGRLSQENMTAFGQAAWERGPVAAGIITASTQAGARALWQRRVEVGNQRLYAANAANPAAHIDHGQLLDFSSGEPRRAALNRDSFIRALRTADYLTFTGHGGSYFLRLEPAVQFTPAYVPRLESAVISTGSCQTVQPWKPDSIALQFIDRGAAAYSGFLFSPNEGYLLGEFNGLPLRYTWPEFPIGTVLLAQNRGTLQGFAAFPYQFLLGDPRIALQAAAPYQVVSDVAAGGRRRLVLDKLPPGVVPVRLAGGFGYDFVRVPGVAAAAKWDPFYNSRLQMVDIGADKYLLLEQDGGRLVIELRQRPPWTWYPLDILLDSLDHSYIFSPQSGGDLVGLVFGTGVLGWLSWRRWRRSRRGRNPAHSRQVEGTPLWYGLGFGLGATLLALVYVTLRLEQVTITSKPVVYSPPGSAAIFLLASCGAWIYLEAGGVRGRVAGLLVATFMSWAPLVGGLGILLAVNKLGYLPRLGTEIYNYNLGLLPAAGWGLALVLFGTGFEAFRRFEAGRPKQI